MSHFISKKIQLFLPPSQSGCEDELSRYAKYLEPGTGYQLLTIVIPATKRFKQQPLSKWAILKFSSCSSTNTDSAPVISDSTTEKKPILTTCWNCSFDLLFVAFVIIIVQNDLPQRILADCKLKCLCSEPCPPANGRKDEINTSSA